ncbi:MULTISPECIES: hypothetical protein [unclassified Mesorhizobium]|uniref:hypothetical protein n=1 Tax=unclassified Mesorhizobium TaxID=325217 RepID=UPI00112D67A7|nr:MULTISPECIES: hypothetical protein [unclassified Mesorhizobium]MBZ9703700.1 hypothetical protein [Mesorhizobium sp. CO1-1-3]MBZ9950496.1 hypothetical protein [Mesorhizobium sp. BR1-1-11]MBZ9961713.1 hypothetical protein [Mesorhizobium sp. BR1-1-14]MCA0022986.1 hypothetical protein [Mesorhizobium sp. B263B1A]TPI56301.1 hypothetical protein FJW11_01250 [Mesorhizobium sp. B3-1-1]
MKKFFLSLTGATVLAGSMAVITPEPAMARHWQGHRPHQVCRIVVKKRVVWRHGNRHVIRQKVRRCHWR